MLINCGSIAFDPKRVSFIYIENKNTVVLSFEQGIVWRYEDLLESEAIDFKTELVQLINKTLGEYDD